VLKQSHYEDVQPSNCCVLTYVAPWQKVWRRWRRPDP